ncbi:MAG: class D sortase [Solirubrobacteraceae bacterium]
MSRRALGVVLVMAGLLVLADAGLTVVWKEPLTALRERGSQQELRRELRAVRLSAPAVRAWAGAPTLASVARRAARGRRDGGALGELRIPRIGVDVVVLSSARPQDLRRGPGLIAPSTVPGRGRTTALAGHRTTYGAPFRHVDGLHRGDPIVLATPYATFRYAVATRRIVEATDVGVLTNHGRDRLVLTACHPLYSAARRIVVVARLTSIQRSATALKTSASDAR